MYYKYTHVYNYHENSMCSLGCITTTLTNQRWYAQANKVNFFTFDKSQLLQTKKYLFFLSLGLPACYWNSIHVSALSGFNVFFSLLEDFLDILKEKKRKEEKFNETMLQIRSRGRVDGSQLEALRFDPLVRRKLFTISKIDVAG